MSSHLFGIALNWSGASTNRSRKFLGLGLCRYLTYVRELVEQQPRSLAPPAETRPSHGSLRLLSPPRPITSIANSLHRTVLVPDLTQTINSTPHLLSLSAAIPQSVHRIISYKLSSCLIVLRPFRHRPPIRSEHHVCGKCTTKQSRLGRRWPFNIPFHGKGSPESKL